MTAQLQTEHPLEFLSLKGGCTRSSESTLVKMPNCWKPQVVARTQFGEYTHLTTNEWAKEFSEHRCKKDSLTMHAQLPCGTNRLDIGMNLDLHSVCMYAGIVDPAETVQMKRLVRAVPTPICNN